MGTIYLKGSTAKLKFKDTASEEYAAKYNGTEVTLTMDSCAECDVFPMVFNGTETHIQVEKEALVWINTLQSDY